MNTKEAIEIFLDNVVRTLLLDEIGAFNDSGRDSVNKKVDEVIELLQHGEKYKEITDEYRKMLIEIRIMAVNAKPMQRDIIDFIDDAFCDNSEENESFEEEK